MQAAYDLSLGKMAEPCDFETAIAQTGFGWFNIMLMAAAFLSAMVCVFDTTAMAYVIPLSQCDLKLSSIDKGALNAIGYAGLISSSLLWGSVSDMMGRIKLLRVALLIDGILAFCSAFSTSLWLLLSLRFIVGFMSCTTLPLTMTFVAEFHGMKYRSRCIMAVGFYLGASQALLPGIGLLMLTKIWEYDTGTMKLHPWHVFVMVSSVPALLGAVAFSLLPETPKFLMAQGRNEEALAVMRKMYATNTRIHPDTYPVESLVVETPGGFQSPEDGTASAAVLLTRVLTGCQQVVLLFTTELVRYTVLVLFIEGCALLSLNTVRLWLPQLFTTLEEFYEAQRLSGNSTPVYMCDALTAHRLEKKCLTTVVPLKTEGHNGSAATGGCCKPYLTNETVYINSMIVCSIPAVVVGLSSILVRLLDYKRVVILCCLLSSVFCMSVLWSTGWVTTVALFTTYLANVNIVCTCVLGAVATIFPTKLRATAVSITMMSGYISALIGNLMFPLVMELGCEVPFYLIASSLFG
ncbi:uncharacterized protein LOC126260363 [Schistocerca nitens]|uniref:uncharacterized protein LOC126260363 n=1 Tax=Schistocerca nitens TaxID=7011 RepID=UPI002117687D|nr:uncharacterized protein LOC126260363 [Schistocerca nitens]